MIGNTRITQAMKNKMAELENPFYLYDQETILGQVRRLHRDFPDFEFLYSIKTNPFLPVVKTILGEGLGLDAASLREVEIGVEYISRDNISSSDRESIILGDGSIFASDSTVTDEKVFELDQAIKILPERGTFIVGVRPRSKMGKIVLRIRWYAYKPEDLEQRVYSQKDQKGCIMIQPDTMVLSPKSSVHINPVFINMPEETLTYTLLDPEGGKIDNNGVYTAPAQEGVYEIKVEALAHPEIFTHAFMIVSQKKTEE